MPITPMESIVIILCGRLFAL